MENWTIGVYLLALLNKREKNEGVPKASPLPFQKITKKCPVPRRHMFIVEERRYSQSTIRFLRSFVREEFIQPLPRILK